METKKYKDLSMEDNNKIIMFEGYEGFFFRFPWDSPEDGLYLGGKSFHPKDDDTVVLRAQGEIKRDCFVIVLADKVITYLDEPINNEISRESHGEVVEAYYDTDEIGEFFRVVFKGGHFSMRFYDWYVTDHFNEKQN